MSDVELGVRTYAKVAAGFVVAAALLYLFGWVVGWGEVLRVLGSADPRWFLLAVGSTTVGLVVWSREWDEILSLIDVEIPFPSLVVLYYAATFADYVTPFGKAGGGPLIAYVLSTNESASYHQSFASVTTADLLNLLPFFGFAAVGLVGLLVRGGLPHRADVLVTGLAALGVAVVTTVSLAWRFRARVEAVLVERVAPIAAHVPLLDVEVVRSEVRGFHESVERISGHPDMLARILGYSIVGWVFFAAPLYLAGRTLGVPLDPLVVLFVVPASTLAGIVPTPGGIGGVEFALAGLLLALAPVSGETAVAVALVYRVASYWYVIAVGGLAAFYVIYRT